MSELRKSFYNHKTISELANALKEAYPKFQKQQFLDDVFNEEWDDLELKNRTIHITKMMYQHLPQNPENSFPIIIKASKKGSGFHFITLSEFIGLYGKAHPTLSLNSLKETTKCCTAEFAIQPFLEQDQNEVFKYIKEWAIDKNHHVRRLASEGCRPLLPWRSKLRKLIADPSPIFPILEQLKTDPEKYVQKSVANNINDISKDHPDLILDFMESWYGKDATTDWIIKHGLRTLLKKGNKRALNLFGHNEKIKVTLTDWSVTNSQINIGEKLLFSFSVTLDEAEKHDVRFEYAIDYMKSNGKQNQKIFQIGTKEMIPNQKIKIKKSQSFQNMSTRKHYSGEHKIHILANGQTIQSTTFTVL